MRAVLQRVSRASVRVDGREIASIGRGLLVLLGVAEGDGAADVEYAARKTVEMRIFEDREGKMNLSLLDLGGEALVVSQFTLLADTRKGRRPAFTGAAPPQAAEALYLEFAARVAASGARVATGRFGAMMEVELVNDGPVTIIIDSRLNNPGHRTARGGNE